MYALAGFSGSTLARVDEYDPATDTWTRRADMLTPRRNFVAGVVNGKIYVAAGMSWTDPNAVTYITATEEYDPATDAWTSKAPCPLATPSNNVYGNVHYGGGAANGRLYVVEFNTNLSSLTATYEYDPGTDRWTTKAPVPFSYQEFATTTLGEELYVLASSAGGGKLAVYDPVGDVWVLRAALPTIALPGLVAANGKVYTVGGVTGDGTLTPLAVSPAVYEYDPAVDRWAARGDLTVSRHSPAAVDVGSEVFVMGGSSTTSLFATPVATVEEGTPRP